MGTRATQCDWQEDKLFIVQTVMGKDETLRSMLPFSPGYIASRLMIRFPIRRPVLKKPIPQHVSMVHSETNPRDSQ